MNKTELMEILENLLAGNIFPMQEEQSQQAELRILIAEQMDGFKTMLPADMQQNFISLTDSILCLQGDLEQVLFNYGCEFATALLLRSLMGGKAYTIMLEKLKL